MAESDVKLEQLKQKLSHLRRSAWKPIVREGDGALTASKFAGTHWLNASEHCPLCPNCNKPMHLILQLNLNELPESLTGRFGSGLLQFFYCTNIETDCEIVCQGWEPFSKSKLVRIVQVDNIGVERQVPKIENLSPAHLIVGWEEKEDYPDCYQGTEDTNIMRGIMLNNKDISSNAQITKNNWLQCGSAK